MTEFKITGVIKKVGELQKFDSGFIKRQIVIDTGGEYPQFIPFELTKEKAEEFHNVEGEEINVFFNIRGSEYNGKHFCSLFAWKITRPENK
jgi:hypothetical protein